MDADGSGMVDMGEIRGASLEVQEQLQDIVDMEEVEELFQALDDAGSGEIGIDEFCDGILKSQKGKSMEMLCVMRQSRHIMFQVNKLMERSDEQELRLEEERQTLSMDQKA